MKENWTQESTIDMARSDKNKLRNKGIKSPDVSKKKFRIFKNKTIFFFSDEKQYKAAYKKINSTPDPIERIPA